MNKIVEIDEKNMLAVCEPYVTSAQLQAELFKRGLNTNIKGSERRVRLCCEATGPWTSRAGPTTGTIWPWSG